MKQLVYDIGFFDGADSQQYLSGGFKVIAVEADVNLFQSGLQKFAKEISTGDLVLLNVGISNKDEGHLKFFINLTNPQWSSFDEPHGTQGGRYKEEYVNTRTLGSLMQEYGDAYYCKIDLEGFDQIAVKSIIESRVAVPRYLSVETSDESMVDLLAEAGYSKFKLINQNDGHTQFDADTEKFIASHGRYPPLWFKPARRLVKQWNKLRYRGHTSGPFGEKTHGSWHDHDTVRTQLRMFFGEGFPLNNRSWFDIHCKQ
jgi:FkbM family methyltransferase